MSENYIQSISHAKLAEYDSTRIDLPIRKYVLIANLLRERNDQEQQKEEGMMLLERHWFETCLNELGREEDEENFVEDIEEDEDEEDIEEDIEENMEQVDHPIKEYKQVKSKPMDLQLHAFYSLRNGRGFIVCSSNLS